MILCANISVSARVMSARSVLTSLKAGIMTGRLGNVGCTALPIVRHLIGLVNGLPVGCSTGNTMGVQLLNCVVAGNRERWSVIFCRDSSNLTMRMDGDYEP